MLGAVLGDTEAMDRLIKAGLQADSRLFRSIWSAHNRFQNEAARSPGFERVLEASRQMLKQDRKWAEVEAQSSAAAPAPRSSAALENGRRSFVPEAVSPAFDDEPSGYSASDWQDVFAAGRPRPGLDSWLREIQKRTESVIVAPSRFKEDRALLPRLVSDARTLQREIAAFDGPGRQPRGDDSPDIRASLGAARSRLNEALETFVQVRSPILTPVAAARRPDLRRRRKP